MPDHDVGVTRAAAGRPHSLGTFGFHRIVQHTCLALSSSSRSLDIVDVDDALPKRPPF